ncbi:hypothetical protein B0H10DRAFT_1957937 [Mycena sp. CBHHK59/15]|nr:hypothetical protein B0H10DRAFT_1957937 [Mycena sp. CBHHK59/15]
MARRADEARRRQAEDDEDSWIDEDAEEVDEEEADEDDEEEELVEGTIGERLRARKRAQATRTLPGEGGHMRHGLQADQRRFWAVDTRILLLFWFHGASPVSTRLGVGTYTKVLLQRQHRAIIFGVELERAECIVERVFAKLGELGTLIEPCLALICRHLESDVVVAGLNNRGAGGVDVDDAASGVFLAGLLLGRGQRFLFI